MNPGPRFLLPSLLSVTLLAGCSPPAPGADGGTDAGRADRPPVVDPTLELGTGQSSWEDLPEGAPVELIHGPQGGYHLFARIRERQLGGDVMVSFRVTPVDGGDAINDPEDRIRLLESRGLLRTSTGWESSSALLVILTRIRGPSEVVGRRFVLEASATPAGSTAVSTVRRTVLVVDET